MSFRRIDMRSLKNKSDIKDYKTLSRRFSWCDKHISNKWIKEMGILLTSHPGNRGFIQASVDTHIQTKLWITLAYDNYFDPNRPSITWNELMPDRSTIDKVNSFILSPHQRWGGVLYPYFWLLRLGLSVMRDFPYVYCANGDCIIEKPEGIFTLLEMLKAEEADFIACGWWDEDRPVFNSTGFIGKSSSVQLMMSHFQNHFIPLKAYEASCQDFGNCEGRMGRAIKDLGFKVVKVDNPKNEQMHEKGHGTWYDVLGFRHIHAEVGYAYKNKLEPPELKYLDPVHFNNSEYELIKKYWDTKDKTVLEAWWNL